MTTTRIIGFSKAVNAGWLRVLDRLHPLKTLFRGSDSGLIVSGQRRQQLGQNAPSTVPGTDNVQIREDADV